MKEKVIDIGEDGNAIHILDRNSYELSKLRCQPEKGLIPRVDKILRVDNGSNFDSPMSHNLIPRMCRFLVQVVHSKNEKNTTADSIV